MARPIQRRRGGTSPKPTRRTGTVRSKTIDKGYKFGPGEMDWSNMIGGPNPGNHLGKPVQTSPTGGRPGTVRNAAGRNNVLPRGAGNNRSVAGGSNPGNHLGKPITSPSPSGSSSGSTSAYTTRALKAKRSTRG